MMYNIVSVTGKAAAQSSKLYLCQPCVNILRLPTEHSVSVELTWYIPAAFKAQQAQAISKCLIAKISNKAETH